MEMAKSCTLSTATVTKKDNVSCWRSLQNAHDLVELCGMPKLALHLECDNTILREHILKHAECASSGQDDDNIHTALKRIPSFDHGMAAQTTRACG
jgi:hypothetical protein